MIVLCIIYVQLIHRSEINCDALRHHSENLTIFAHSLKYNRSRLLASHRRELRVL